MEAKVVTLRDFSLSFNSLYNETKVIRDHLIGEIEEFANKGNKVIVLEGNEGSGKTNLLLQFAKKHNQDSFTYFINSSCSSTYRQDYLMEDLGRQINYYNNSNDQYNNLGIDEVRFSKIIFELLKNTNKKNKRLYFIIDGIDQIEKSDQELLKICLQSLPWNVNNFCFLVSGDTKKLKSVIPSTIYNSIKSIWVSRFTFDEACLFFGIEEGKDKDYLREIYDTWKGHPEDLSQIKSIIDSGTTIEEFVNDDSIKEKNDLIELLWNKYNLDEARFEEEVIQLLSIIVFNDNIQHVQRLSNIINSSIEYVLSLLEKFSFLSINSLEVSFSSKSFRNFLVNKLKKHKKKSIALLIDYHTSRKDLEAIKELPNLYDQIKEWSDILNLLSLDNISLIVSNSKSFSEIKKQIDYGYSASLKMNNAFSSMLNFSLYRSTLLSLQKSDNKEDQVEAYISLGKTEEALSLISTIVLKEDRLKLLILYAKLCKLKTLDIDELVISEVKESLNEVDQEYLREHVSDIVIGLAYFLPEVAVRTIEKISGLGTENNSLEWLINYVALIINKNNVNEDDISASNEKTKNNNSFLDEFIKSIGFNIGHIGEENIIGHIDSTENVNDKIYFIRNWINNNKFATNIHYIINYAIDLLLQSSAVVKPTTTILLDLISPLSQIVDESEVCRIIERVEELVRSVYVPTNDKVRIDILIIESLVIFNIDIANDKVIVLDNYIETLNDYSIRVESLADLWALAVKIHNNNSVNSDQFILDVEYVKDKLIKSIADLLETTAEHYDELKGVIEIISKFDFQFGLHISRLLNTEDRRDVAVIKCIEIYCENKVSDWNVVQIKEAIESIDDNRQYSNAILTVFDSANDQLKETSLNLPKIVDLIPLIEKVSINSFRCFLLTRSISFLQLKSTHQSGLKVSYNNFTRKLEGFLAQYWNKIEMPWQKAMFGYKISSKLTSHNTALAEDYLSKSLQISEDVIIDNVHHASVYYQSIRLVIRFYSAIIANDKAYKYDKIEHLINQLPSRIEKIQLWAELAVRAKFAGVASLTEQIVSKKIIPIVDYYKEKKDKEAFYNVVSICASAIHHSQPSVLKLYLQDLPIRKKESVIYSVCYVLFTGRFEVDPYNDKIGHKNFRYQDAVEVIDLLNQVGLDIDIFSQIRRLSYVCKKYPNNFPREQKSSLRQSLMNLVNTKLPTKDRGIKHEGFKIVSEACIQHFNISDSNNVSIFEDLDKRTEKLDNARDRSFVYSILSTECSIKKKKSEFILKSFQEADKILSFKEKVNAYERALDASKDISKEVFTAHIRKINEELYNLDSSDMFPTFRKLIDLAYGVDKTLAQRLVSTLDNDPGRSKLSAPSTNHLETLELVDAASSDYSQFGRLKSRKLMANTAWEFFGQLNSGTRHSREVFQTIPILRAASKLPFDFSLPLFELFCENSIKHEQSGKNLIVPFYEAAYSNSKLAFSLICSISNKDSILLSDRINTGESFLALPNSRDDAFEYISSIIKNYQPKDIFIIDPYFSEIDLDFIKQFTEWSYGANFSVLSSCDAKGDFSKFSYSNFWRGISSEDFPNATFVKVTAQNNTSPLHDRWIILNDKSIGIRLGTSINSVGKGKVSEISLMSLDATKSQYESVVVPLIKYRVREYEDYLVKYESFDM